jgi:hypothetical protein
MMDQSFRKEVFGEMTYNPSGDSKPRYYGCSTQIDFDTGLNTMNNIEYQKSAMHSGELNRNFEILYQIYSDGIIQVGAVEHKTSDNTINWKKYLLDCEKNIHE